MAVPLTRKIVYSLLSVLTLGLLIAAHLTIHASNYLNCRDGNIAVCTALIDSFLESKEGRAAEYMNRGIAYSLKDNPDSAIADLSAAIQLNPNLPQVYYHRAVAYNSKSKYGEAVADYNEAIHLKPDYAYAFNNRGSIYALARRYDVAIADFTAAIRLKPDFAMAYYNRGFAKHKTGDVAGGDQDVETAKKLGLDDKQ